MTDNLFIVRSFHNTHIPKCPSMVFVICSPRYNYDNLQSNDILSLTKHFPQYNVFCFHQTGFVSIIMTRILSGNPDGIDEKVRVHQRENLVAILIDSTGLYNFLEKRGYHFGIGDGSKVIGGTRVIVKSKGIEH